MENIAKALIFLCFALGGSALVVTFFVAIELYGYNALAMPVALFSGALLASYFILDVFFVFWLIKWMPMKVNA